MITKKRTSLLAILVTILMVFAMMPMTMDQAQAETAPITVDGVIYTPNEDGTTATVTGYTADLQSTVMIQSSVGDGGKYTVTSIGNRAFMNCGALGSITIPANVTSIGKFAFSGTGLTTATFANNSKLESIGADAFNGCSSLGSITIPANVTSIGGSAFYNSGLTTVTFENENNIKSLETGIFEKCSNLGSITIPKSVTSIGQ